MSLFTTADRDAVKAAMVRAAVDGIASVTVVGETVTARSPDDLQKLLQMILQDLATASAPSTLGMRMVKTIPPAAG